MKFADVHLSGAQRTARFPLYFGVAHDDDYRKLPIPSTVETVFVVADAAVDALHGKALEAKLGCAHSVQRIPIMAGEASKSLGSLEFLLERLINGGANRRSYLLSFGGGMIGNLTGLAASLLFRGVRFAHLPTTLLAGSDSVISLKQAVNSRYAKNTFGCYASPDFAFFDFRWLATLPAVEFRSGLCESIKNALAIRPQSITRLGGCLRLAADDPNILRWIVEDSIGAKLSVIANDPTEQHEGLVLEYGHTVGHAVELADRQSRGPRGLAHGEAVAVGMIAEATIANRLGLLSDADLDTHRALIAAAGATDEIPPHLDRAELMARIDKDNKRGHLRQAEGDEVALVLLEGLGRPVRRDGLPIALAPRKLVDEVLGRIQRRKDVAVSVGAADRPEVTVVILTTGKRATLPYAVASVFAQDFRPIQLLLVVDGGETVPPAGEPPPGCSVRVVRVGRDGPVQGRAQTLSHVARLRNIALELVRTPLLAFLDDDNRWAPDHLSSLYAALTLAGANAAHSWRRVVSEAGDSVGLTAYPWLPQGLPLERKTFAACAEAGLLREGDGTIRDAVTGAIGLQTGLVDMGSWLLRRETLSGFRFPEKFTSRELAEGAGEDDALLAFLNRRGGIACSERATLDYRLGGFSNGGDALERRGRNIALSRLDIEEGRTTLRAMPRFVLVELSRFCNLACSMCREPGAIDKTQTMSAETFARIEAEILPFADIIDLRGWGESLLLPEFPDRLARAVKLGARTRVVTNLSFQRDAVLAQLAEAGTYVGVSLDAADAKILQTLRRGANAGLIVRNMATLGESYNQRGIADRIAIYLTVQRPAIGDLANVVELAASCGIRDIRLAPVTGCDHLPIGIDGSAAALKVSLGEVRRRARTLGVMVSTTARLPGEDDLPGMPSPCLHPWTHCYVAWDGRIGFCDHLIGPAGDDYILGSLGETSFHDIWNGDGWTALRAEHLNGKRAAAPHFAECAWCYRNRHLDSEDLLEAGLAAKRRVLKDEPHEVPA